MADVDRRRHPLQVAIENRQHDLNIGTVVRTANAFLAAVAAGFNVLIAGGTQAGNPALREDTLWLEVSVP